MNIALVDDIPSELDRLEAILDDYAASNGLNIDVSRFSSAEELLDGYRPYQYTIVFLDIYMQGASGVEAARLIRETDSDTIIVFQTTSTEHMADAFQTHAYEYVIKPVQPDRIFALMDDVLRRSAAARGKHFSFTCDRQNYELAYSEIESVQGSGNYLNVTDSRGNTYRTRMTFSAASKTLLEDARFLQLMRGVLVNMDLIVGVRNGACIMKSGARLPISVRSTKSIEQTWRNYMFSSIRNRARRLGEGSHG